MPLAAAGNLTIPRLFEATVGGRADEPALGIIQGGGLTWRTWRQLAEKAAAWARFLSGQGVRPGDRVAQLSPNNEGWICADLAIQIVGAVHVPLHTSLAASQMVQQIRHSGAKLVLTDSSDSAAWISPELAGDHQFALHSELPSDDGQTPPQNGPGPDDLATILYTSGTTGNPRGVMLTHRNIAANTVATSEQLATSDEETRLLLLPVSHIYARTCDLYCWIYRGTKLVIAESRETALRDCQLARPTVMNAVPYFYQKVAAGLCKGDRADDKNALRDCFGGAIEHLYCGGAALAPQVEQFFLERGLPILCGYGLTEASPVITASTPQCHSAGTVGRPLANVEVQLADDGEILVRGPSVMRGYWQNDADTAAVLRDGWLATGDLGSWAENGNLRIVGRKKEMLVLSTGKKVAPTWIEQLLIASPLIEQCCVVGDGRKCLGALIVPDREALAVALRKRSWPAPNGAVALKDPQIRELYRREVDRCLAEAAGFEQVGCFEVLSRSFSLDRGELTPKLSLCRSVIQKEFAEEIERMYRTVGCEPGQSVAQKRS